MSLEYGVVRICNVLERVKQGEIVYDGPPDSLTSDVLTRIYGEEDWEATIETVEDDEEENGRIPEPASAAS